MPKLVYHDARVSVVVASVVAVKSQAANGYVAVEVEPEVVVAFGVTVAGVAVVVEYAVSAAETVGSPAA